MIKKRRTTDPIILTIYFVLKPFYLWSSGLPQPADLLLIMYMVIAVMMNGGKLKAIYATIKWKNTFFVLCIIQLLVNLFWYLFTDDREMIVASAQYFFNYLAISLCIHIIADSGVEKTAKAVCSGSFISVLIAAVSVMLGLGNDKSGRPSGFFNNPNQLGYYAIIVLTIMLLFRNMIHKKQYWVMLFATIYLNIQSLSKASVISVVILLLAEAIVLYREDRNIKRFALMLLIVSVLGTIIFLFLFSDLALFFNSPILLQLKTRMIGISTENDSSLMTGRGYARVYEMGINYLWGMGEGAYERFETLKRFEVHSTYINLFVSYGVIVFAGYIKLFAQAIKCHYRTFRNIAYMSGLFFYFLTHNGIRNTLLWILLALLISDNQYYLENKKSYFDLTEYNKISSTWSDKG